MFSRFSIGPFLPAKRAVWIGAYYVGTESGKKVDKTSFYFLSNKDFNDFTICF
jgi:hypothetical protein